MCLGSQPCLPLIREKALAQMLPVGKTQAGPITSQQRATTGLVPLRGKGAAVRRPSLAEAEGAGVAAVQSEGGRVQRD